MLKLNQIGFAAAAYRQMSLAELSNALFGEPDPVALDTWDLTFGEWREAIVQAYDKKYSEWKTSRVDAIEPLFDLGVDISKAPDNTNAAISLSNTLFKSLLAVAAERGKSVEQLVYETLSGLAPRAQAKPTQYGWHPGVRETGVITQWRSIRSLVVLRGSTKGNWIATKDDARIPDSPTFQHPYDAARWVDKHFEAMFGPTLPNWEHKTNGGRGAYYWSCSVFKVLVFPVDGKTGYALKAVKHGPFLRSPGDLNQILYFESFHETVDFVANYAEIMGWRA